MEEIDLKELFRLFLNKKAHICIIVAIFMVIGIIYTIGFVSPEYTASTTLVLASTNSNKTDISSITTTDITLNAKLVSTYREVVKSKSTLGTVISNLNIDIEYEDLKENVTVTSVEDTEVIKISVTDADSRIAQKIANEIANVFIGKVKDIYKIENVQILDVAEFEEEPSNVNHIRDIAIFTAIGIVISIVYVFMLNMFDTTVKAAEEIESTYDIPVLVSIPIYEDNMQKQKGGKR